MSSILKALQKVEHDAATQSGGPSAPLPAEWAPVRRNAGRADRSKMLRLFLCILIPLGLLGLGLHQFGGRQATAPLSRQVPPLPRENEAPPAPEQPVQNRKSIAQPVQEAPSENIVVQAPESGTAMPGQPQKTAFESPSSSKQTQGPLQAEHPVPNTAIEPAEAPKSALQAAGPSDETFAALPHSTENGYTLQALVWSRKPAQRWAMINGRSIKTGERINKAEVIYIGRDFIIFEKNGKQWKHIFLK